MKLDVVGTVEEIRSDQIHNRTVIVIDVLRASSSIVTALASGYASVIPVETIGQAHLLKNDQTILVGERHCKKIAEFDYNNSPSTLAKTTASGRHVILTTTNGTRAIQKAERAALLLIACFLNASAVVRHALSMNQDITLYCAGTRQEFALEDGLAAGLIIEGVRQLRPTVSISDFGEAMRFAYLHVKDHLRKQLQETTTGKRLLAHHFAEDIAFCAQTDLYGIVPCVKDGRILPCPVT